MAYDKVIDSAQLEADLTSVANAIRTKGGTSGSLDFPADFVNVISSIKTGGNVMMEVHDITIASALTGKASYRPVLFSGSEFVKKYYANDNLFALFYFTGGVLPEGAYNIGGIAHMNRPFLDTGTNKYYAIGAMNPSSGTSYAATPSAYKLSSEQPYNAGLMTKSNGDICISLPANRNLAAGTYRIVLGIIE